MALEKDACSCGDRSWCGAWFFEVDVLIKLGIDVIVSEHLSPQFESIRVLMKSPKAKIGQERLTMGAFACDESYKKIRSVFAGGAFPGLN